MIYDISEIAARIEANGLEPTITELLDCASPVQLMGFANAVKQNETTLMVKFMCDIVKKMEDDAQDISIEENVKKRKAESEFKKQLDHQNRLYEQNCM